MPWPTPDHDVLQLQWAGECCNEQPNPDNSPQKRLDPNVSVHSLRVTALTTARERGSDIIDLHEFMMWSAGATILRGRALAEQGALEEGIADIQRGLSAWRSTGAVVNTTYYLGLLADTLGAAGRLEEGLAVIAEAIVLARETEEQYYAAELYRIKGELLRRAGECRRVSQAGGTKASPISRTASSCFREAITLARRQGAKALERRAAMCVASKRR